MCEQEGGNQRDCQCRVERAPNYAMPRLLLELARKTSHGYELIERLGQEGGGAPDPGNFYRMLRQLEEDGCVCSTWDTQNSGPARRVYELTDQGREYLNAWAVTVRQTRELLSRFLSEYEALTQLKGDLHDERM